MAQGVSTYVILAAIRRNNNGGRLISIDLPNYDTKYVGSTRQAGWLVPSDFHRDWDLQLGRSTEILPKIYDPIEMFYHDSLHNYETMSFEYEWAYGRLGVGGVLASDDINATRAFRDFKETHPNMKVILGVRSFGNLIKGQ
ncbi:MAG: class I SAM-dependent methyltransferase [Thaumarchaeota archaeon]|nr:class I SAM-dependent methyltransferase [Nitrososphaerota archaeon]